MFPAMRIVSMVVSLGLTPLVGGHPQSQGVVPNPVPELFVSLRDAADPSGQTGDPGESRGRQVLVRRSLLQAARRGSGSTRIELNLFRDRSMITRFERFEDIGNDGFLAYGRIEGRLHGQVFLALNGEAVVGSVRDGLELYRVRPSSGDRHAVVAIDESRYAPCGIGDEHRIKESSVQDGVPMGSQPITQAKPTDARSKDPRGETIDIMIVYTTLSQQTFGGPAAMEAALHVTVAETNQAFQNSGVLQHLRLVHVEELFGYVENGDFSTELNRLTNMFDGHIDHIHALRDQFGADAVAMIVDSNQWCGLAWVLSSGAGAAGMEYLAFSVTSNDCLVGSYTLAHELGHNFGCDHDRANPSAGGGAYPYSWGYRTPSGNWRTIMAYFPGATVPYFSNPNISFFGETLGIAHPSPNSAENWKSLNHTAWAASEWRCTAPQPFGVGETTSVGTVATLGHSGAIKPIYLLSPSLTLELSGGVPGKPGICLYGTKPNSSPFLGHVLYVGGAIKRLPPQVNTGAGRASFPFPASGLPIGGTAYVQYWGRDNQNPNGTGTVLSNGLYIEYCP